MKSYIAAIVLSSLTVLTATAQSDGRLRNDHTVSTHNYKHPKKAATAQQWARQRGETISARGLDNRTVSNYKQPVPNAAPADGYLVTHRAGENLANRNYKIQRTSNSLVVTQDQALAEKPSTDLPNEND